MSEVVKLETKKCPFCRKSQTMILPKAGHDKWKAGAFVQNAFPGMSSGDRELLITGTHPKCWDDNMPNGDED